MRAVPLAQGALVLNCPGCGTKVADGTSICPKCDYIIDSSFLSSEPPSGDGDDESTAASEDPRKAASASRAGRAAVSTSSRTGAGTTGKVRAVPSTTGKSGPRAAVTPGKSTGRTGPRPAVRPATQSRAPEPEPQAAAEEKPEPPPRKAILPPLQPPSASRAAMNSGKVVAPEQMMEDAREFISDLSKADKLALAGASVVVLSCFLPWKETAADGDILGLMSSGFGAMLLALAVIGTLLIRVRQSMPRLNPLLPWLVQLSSSVLCVLYTLIVLRLSVDSTEVPSAIGNQMIMNSSPSMGVFIAMLGGLGAMAGSLMGLKERPT
jgi:hypothetical protein